MDPLAQSWLDFLELSPPATWPPSSGAEYIDWLVQWAEYARSLGLDPPLPLTTPT